MKIRKIILSLLLFLLLIPVLILGVLSSQRALDTTLTVLLQKSGLPLSYQSLQGDLWSGLALKGVNYAGKAEGDVTLKVDFPALREGTLHIQKLYANNIRIDKSFLASLLESNTTATDQKDQQSSPLPLKNVIVDDLELSLYDVAYGEYQVHSLEIRGQNLAYDMHRRFDGNLTLSLTGNVADVRGDIQAAQSVYEGDIMLTLHESYLSRLAPDKALRLDSDPVAAIALHGDLAYADFNLTIRPFGVGLSEYRIENQMTALAGSYRFEENLLQAHGALHADSNVATLASRFETSVNIVDINHTLTYRLDASGMAFKPEFAKILGEENLSFEKSSTIVLKAQGDMQAADANLSLEGGEITYGPYRLTPRKVALRGHYDMAEGRFQSSGEGNLTTNAGSLSLRFESGAKADDIPRTLVLSLEGDVVSDPAFVNRLLQESNITFQQAPVLHIVAHTVDEKKIVADITLKESRIRYQKDLQLKAKMQSHATFHTDTQWLETEGGAVILSNAADVRLDYNSSMQVDDIAHKLKYDAQFDIRAKEDFFRQRLKQNVDFSRLSPLKLTLRGDAKAADAKLTCRGEGVAGKYRFKTDIKDTKFHYDMRSNRLEGRVFGQLYSTIADLNIDTNLSLDTKDINQTLQYHLIAVLRQKEAVSDINLTQLGEIDMKAEGTLKKLDAQLVSPKLTASVKSGDFRRFDFSLDSKTLFLDKLYTALPADFRKSRASVRAEGFYDLNRVADIMLQVKSLHLHDRDIHTNRFRVTMNKEAFSLAPVELRAKDFLLKVTASQKEGMLHAKIENRAFDGYLNFRKEPLFAEANMRIPDIAQALAQINKIYPLKSVPSVKGSLFARASMAGTDRIKIALNSPKISFDAGRIEALNIISFYTPLRVDIPDFSFRMRGFKPKKMNRDIMLEHPAVIVWDAQHAKVDFVLKNLLSFQATKEGDLLLGKFRTKKLFLAYPEYGQTRLSMDIDLYKSAEQTALSGDVELEDTEITYESRVLDVSQDPDIVIIKDRKKRRQTDDNFIKNTFLDLRIRSKDDVIYKVEAGTIALRPDIEVRKDFGSNVRLLGKINIIEGEYDWGDKRFKLKEGAIAFRGLEEVNPHLDLHVEYEIEDVLIFIDILGDKRKPKLVFKSKPMMSKKDIFSYLLFGFAVSESDGAQSSAASAAEKIFGRALAKDLARELNLDRLDLTRNQLGGINIKAGKKLNKKTIIYYQNKDASSSMIVERKLGRHMELDTQIGQDSQAVDLVYKKGFK